MRNFPRAGGGTKDQYARCFRMKWRAAVEKSMTAKCRLMASSITTPQMRRGLGGWSSSIDVEGFSCDIAGFSRG